MTEKTKNDWHFVKNDDLPPYNNRVLVVDGDGIVFIGRYELSGWIWDGYCSGEIVAWQELPMPPKIR